METILVFLKGFAIVGIPFGCIIYYVCATSEKDALYFMRKRQFKQKVLKNGYNSTWELVDSLIHTSAKDWTKTTYHMYYEPFPGTTMWFKDSLGLNLEITEGSGNKQVFDVDFFDDTDKVAYRFKARISR